MDKSRKKRLILTVSLIALFSILASWILISWRMAIYFQDRPEVFRVEMTLPMNFYMEFQAQTIFEEGLATISHIGSEIPHPYFKTFRAYLSHNELSSRQPNESELEWEMRCDNLPAVKALVSQGADVNLKSKMLGKSPLWISVLSGDLEMTRFLITAGAKDEKGECLMLAVKQGYPELLNLILSISRANINYTDKAGLTPLMEATRRYHSSNGFDSNFIEWRNAQGNYFSERKHPERNSEEVFRILISQGADVNIKENHHWTALMMGIEKRNIKAVKILLENGADPNIQANDKTTALIQAVKLNPSSPEIIKILLAHRADMNTRDTNNHTALDVARLYHRKEIADLLTKAGAQKSSSLRNKDSSLRSE
jgi:uncharacterized protein